MSPKVAIVILNWNGRNFLQQFLPSVLESTYANKEVIVADNSSTDDSVQFLRQQFPQVRIISLKENYGFAKGYNEALKLVEGDYYVMLNSDVEVTPGWIEPVIELLESEKTIGAAQPKILSYNQRDKFEYAGAAGGWMDYLGYPFARGRVFDTCENDEGQYDSAAPIFWASGAAMFVRAAVFYQLNGLDNYFFAHMEEIDFCWRLQLAGYSVYACPKSKVFHVGAGTLHKDSSQKIFLNFRNNLIMLAKNMTWVELVWKIPFRFLLNAITGLKFLMSGQALSFLGVVKAHFAFIYWACFKKGESIFPSTKRIEPQGFFQQSVVWNYFILGKKTFTEIIKGKD